ncbi:MAG: hypothetical protein ACRC5W_06125 [Cetobacterium sp.]|uniref:hypothetical protein n=1 Tax=Cetobacterium sp. TaxID=2071632 RepID=UPI003F2E49AC
MKIRIENRIAKVVQNAEILDKRAYFTLDVDGVVKRKNMNYTIPGMVFCEDDSIFNTILEKESNKIEREKEKKIDRLSNISLEKLKDNFVKLVVKGEIEFSKRYGKELALRNSEEFLKVLFNLSLMDNPEFNKPLMALAMKEILNSVGWIDEIGYLVISYFTKQKYDLNALENALETETVLSNDIENLSLVAYKKVLNAYSYKNEKKYKNILNTEILKNEEKEMSEIEKQILKNIKF